MNVAHRWIEATVCTLFLASAACASAQDWPQWRGPDRDGKVTGFTAPQSWPAQLTAGWKVTVGPGDSTPALVGARLYVCARQGADEVTLCLDATTGNELWRDQYPAQAVTGAAARHPGPRSSPAVAEGRVVTVGAGGVVSCLDAASGKLAWRKDPFPGQVPRFFAATSPVIVAGMAIAHLGGSDQGAIVAFDLASGEPKWTWTGGGPTYDSPVLADVDGTRQLVTMTEKSLVGIALDTGTTLWSVPAEPQSRYYNSPSPVVDGRRVFYTGQGTGTRAVELRKEGDAFTVKELWHNPELGTAYNTPVLKDGLLYGLSDKGYLFCVNAENGATAWVDTTKRPNFGAIVDAGTVILALASDAELLVYGPSDKEYSELARIKVADGATYAHPVVAGNRIYVRDEQAVALWTL